jgi:hypothetical protein
MSLFPILRTYLNIEIKGKLISNEAISPYAILFWNPTVVKLGEYLYLHHSYVGGVEQGKFPELNVIRYKLH